MIVHSVRRWSVCETIGGLDLELPPGTFYSHHVDILYSQLQKQSIEAVSVQGGMQQFKGSMQKIRQMNLHVVGLLC